MGTNGTVVYVVEGESKAQYVHNDSYPESLGVTLLKWLRKHGTGAATYVAVEALRTVPDREPTPAEVGRLGKYADTGVSTGSFEDWYCLLRRCQGDPDATLASGFVYGDGYASGFYTYTLDFDHKRFTVADGSGEALGSWRFDELPEKNAFLRAVTDEDED